MPTEITVPRLGWSMEEAIFSGWLKQAGGMIRAGDLLFAIESDKATQEIESLDAGLLHIPLDGPNPGDKVLMGQVLGYLLAEGESAPVAQSPVPGGQAPAQIPTSQVAAPPAVRVKPELPLSTPRARRAARELSIDWTEVAGSGRGGRVREADIRVHAPGAMSPTRRIIAARMIASQQKTAPVTLHTTADASALVQLRAAFKADAASPVTPGYNDMLVKLTATALQAHPVLNSRWEGEHLRTLPDVHIGIAVDTEAGLLVPVIRASTKLSLQDIAAQSRDLTSRARSAGLTAEELRGGTFTVTSLGSFGIDAFTPVINYPECAILGVGRIKRQPVAADDGIALRDMITLSLTFDHCAFDGALAARFLQTLVQLIESPASLS